MADYDLKYTGAQIDGLLDAANELKTNGFIYKGVATPSTNPGTPSERVAYLASEPGTYTNFGGIVIASGLYSFTYAGGTWTGTQMSAGADIEVVQTTGDSTTDVMSQKAVTDELSMLIERTEYSIDMTAFTSLGAGSYLDANGVVITSGSNQLLYIKAKKGDTLTFTCTHTASKTFRCGLFADIPVMGSSVISGTFATLSGKNITYQYIMPQDGYYAIAGYYGNGTYTYKYKEQASPSYYNIDFSVLAQVKGWVGGSSKYAFTDWGSHYAIKVGGSTRVLVEPQTGKSVCLFFVKTYHNPSSESDINLCSTCTNRLVINTKSVLFLPCDCQYIVVGGWTGQDNDYTPLVFGMNDYDGELYDDVKEIDNTFKYIYFAQGSYGTTGIRSYNTSYVRSCLFQGERTISVNAGYSVKYVFKWVTENHFVNFTTLEQSVVNIPNDGYYYSIVINKTDNSVISPNEEIINYFNTQKTIYDSLIGNNLERLKSATLNIIGDSVSNPDRSEYSMATIWWNIMCNALGVSVGTYSCISGTPVGGSAANAFHNRVRNLTLDGTITIIAGGMNDLGADNIPLGTFDYASSLSSQINADATLTNKFIPAYRELIEYILSNNKHTRLYLCTITPRAIKKTNMSDAELFFPWTNKVTHNNWLEYNEAIRKLAHDYGVGLIDFANIGMYQQNGFADESNVLPADNIWTTDGVHPNVTYQKKMGDLATRILAETML